MIELTKGQLIRAMTYLLADVAGDHIVYPSDLLHGGKRKGERIVEARTQYIHKAQQRFVQWQVGHVWHYGDKQSGVAEVPPRASPLSNVIVASVCGMLPSSVVQARRRVPKE